MKILIAYAQAGEGHRRAATAFYNYLRQNHKELDVRLIDTLEYSSFLFKSLYNRTYTTLITRLPWLWGAAYHLSRVRLLRPFIKQARYITNRVNTRGFIRLLEEYKPDVVIATHFMAPAVISYLKERKRINTRLITVITDYNVHPFWLTNGTDIYTVPCAYAKDELLADNVPADKIKITGIPVDAKFCAGYDKKESRAKLGIESDCFTTLIATSGFGIGPIEEIVELLHADMQLLVVCGRNEKLYKKLQDGRFPRAKIFGFVNNMEELMACSDIFITKPGGMTITESLNLGIPMLFISGIAGQESRNARIMEDYGVAIVPKNLKNLKNIILDLKNKPENLKRMAKKVDLIKSPFASKEICECFLPR